MGEILLQLSIEKRIEWHEIAHFHVLDQFGGVVGDAQNGSLAVSYLSLHKLQRLESLKYV